MVAAGVFAGRALMDRGRRKTPVEDLRPWWYRVLDDRLGDAAFDCWNEAGFQPEKIDQPRELLLIWAARWLDTEVNNGGFHQFFWNGTGVVAPEAVEGFHLIGLTDCIPLIEGAMEFFGEPYPRVWEIRDRRLKEFMAGKSDRDEWDPFAKRDDEYYALMSGDRFDDAAGRYMERFR